MNTHGEGRVTRRVPLFEVADMGAPFKIQLKNSISATFDDQGKMLSYDIPDYPGLERAVAFARLIHNRKLSGKEWQFLRKLLSVKQQDFAKSIELSVEHVSKVENGKNVLSPSSEKLARIYLIKAAMKVSQFKSSDVREMFEGAIDKIFDDLTPVAASDANDVLVFTFVQGRPISTTGANDNNGIWDHGPEAISAC